MDADAIYLSKVEHFERLYDDRVDTAVSLLGGDPQSVREIETAREGKATIFHDGGHGVPVASQEE